MAFIVMLVTLFKGMLSADVMNPNALMLLNSFTRNCEIVYIDENSGYGLRATKDIHYGDTIMVIPPIYMLTTFDKYPWLGKFESYTSEFRLTIRLLYEKFVVKENSNRKILIDALPKNFSNIFTFTQEQKFKFGEYFDKSIRYNLPVNCISDYELFIKFGSKFIKNDKECLKYENFLWACQVVFTRGYTYYKYDHYLLTQNEVLASGENTKGTALILGADMFNHYPMPEFENSVDDYGINYVGDPAFIDLRADRTISTGEEVFISYGPKSNIELYLIHGFIVENNPDDYGIIGIPGDGNHCKNFSQKSNYCEFYINAKELSAEIVNYLFYRLTDIQLHLKKISDLVAKKDQGVIKTLDLIEVLRTYKRVLSSNSINRCKGEIKLKKNLDKSDLLERLCQENHKLFTSHILRLDYFIISIFHSEMIKVIEK